MLGSLGDEVLETLSVPVYFITVEQGKLASHIQNMG